MAVRFARARFRRRSGRATELTAFDPLRRLRICENSLVAHRKEVAFVSKASRPPNPDGVAANFITILCRVKVRVDDELGKATSDSFRAEGIWKGAYVLDGIIDRRLERLLVLGSVRTCIVAMRFKLLLMQ